MVVRHAGALVLIIGWGCQREVGPGLEAGGDRDVSARLDAGLDARGTDAEGPGDDGDGGEDATRDASPDNAAQRPDAGPGRPRGAFRFVLNAPRAHEYGQALTIPPAFGSGEFTLELFVRLDASYPVGPTTDGTAGQLRNWTDADVRPYRDDQWWYAGNFLLDGHNNASFDQGTFSVQFYGGGRVRWLLGDGAVPRSGRVWSVGAFPASGTPSLLDSAWHGVALVRRFVSGAGASLEIWIDGRMVASETTTTRPDLRRWWDAWPGFPSSQAGWFWGAEKQAAIGVLAQYEDFKGDLAELRFWSIARPRSVLAADWDRVVRVTDAGLVGWVPFDEGSGDRACDALDRARCIVFRRASAASWRSDGPPLR